MRQLVKEAVQRIEQWRLSLDGRRIALEKRFGYEGSPRTLARAFERASLEGSALKRAEQWGRRLYVAWESAQPFFSSHLNFLLPLFA